MVALFRNILVITVTNLCIGMMPHPLFARLQERVDGEHPFERSTSSHMGAMDTLTVDMAVEMALERNAELKLLNTEVQVAIYRFDSSGRIDNPELRLRELSSHYFNEHRDELQFGLRWRLPELGESALAKQEARVEIWRRTVEAQRFRHRLAADVRRTCADIDLYDRLTEFDHEKMKLESERVTLAEGMMDLGRGSVIDLIKAGLNRAESKSEYTRTAQRRNQARRTLAGQIGSPGEFDLTIEEVPEVNQPVDLLIAMALKNRPEIELTRQRKLLAEKERAFESRQVIPWPTFIELSYHALRDREDWDELRLGVNLPLFNWNGGNRKATGLAAEKWDLESDCIRHQIEEEVRIAHAVYLNNLQDWKAYRTDIAPLIREAATVLNEDGKHGTLPPDDVLDMKLTVNEAWKELVEKKCDLAHALADLYFALGIEGSEDLRGEREE